jgi:hypothetical protein
MKLWIIGGSVVVLLVIAIVVLVVLPTGVAENPLAQDLNDRLLVLVSGYGDDYEDPLPFRIVDEELRCPRDVLETAQGDCSLLPGYARRVSASTPEGVITIDGLAFADPAATQNYYRLVETALRSLEEDTFLEIAPSIADLTTRSIGRDVEESLYAYLPGRDAQNSTTYLHLGVARMDSHVFVIREESEDIFVKRRFNHAFDRASWNQTITYYNLTWDTFN